MTSPSSPDDKSPNVPTNFPHFAAAIRGVKAFYAAPKSSDSSLLDPKIKEAKRKVLMKQHLTRFYFKPPSHEK